MTIQATINIVGVKVKGKTLISRKDACALFGIKSETLTNKLSLFPELREARIKTVAGELWDVEKMTGLQISK